uniref:Transposase n=1 Tax=Polaromonas sp. E3S TaxID=1840265 RepID=A0A2S1FHV7_9BURK|nr:hypothetical protein pE3SP1_p013 [Polaromonas sp. E3S]
MPADIEINQVTADGAYDGEATYKTILDRQGDITVVIPPRAGALPSQADGSIVTQRDAHVLMMESLGRLGWQEAAGYGKKSLVETAMGALQDHYWSSTAFAPTGCIAVRSGHRGGGLEPHDGARTPELRACCNRYRINSGIKIKARLFADPCNNASKTAFLTDRSTVPVSPG